MAEAPGLWITRCDPNQLDNALLNLCINACDAMPEGGVLTPPPCTEMSMQGLERRPSWYGRV